MAVAAGRAAAPWSRNLNFISDGALSSLEPGAETNAGLLFRLRDEVGPQNYQQVDYDRGVQGTGWRKWFNAITGMGINLSIRQGYSILPSRYHPGDRIYLFGYLRGAQAVRSLVGMIGGVGLLRPEMATERNVRRAFRLYESNNDGPRSLARTRFAEERCHENVAIEKIGVWDTVRALGLPYPVLGQLAQTVTDFHDHAMGQHIRHGYHALAIDEYRCAYAPILWERSEHWEARLEHAWLPGAHHDVGEDLRDEPEALLVSNIPLNRMLSRAELHGLILPEGRKARFPEDPAAPITSNRRGTARCSFSAAPA